MRRAGMPKATVHEYGDSRCHKCEVWSAWHASVEAIAQTGIPDGQAETNFHRGIRASDS